MTLSTDHSRFTCECNKEDLIDDDNGSRTSKHRHHFRVHHRFDAVCMVEYGGLVPLDSQRNGATSW